MRCKDKSLPHIVDLWSFRSSKSNKRYIVEIEEFEEGFYGIKYYWKGVEKSKDRYSMLTNDYEPRKIVRSCIEVMLDYYRRNPYSSFGFVAAPDLAEDIKGKRAVVEGGNRRFRFYQRMMVNLFGPETFYQVADTTNTIYLLINMKRLTSGDISITDIEHSLNQTYLGDYVING